MFGSSAFAYQKQALKPIPVSNKIVSLMLKRNT